MALLEIQGLTKRFPIRRGILRRVQGWVHAVDRVSMALEAAQTLGLVGESGCGKTTLGRMALGLIAPDAGQVLFRGRPLRSWLEADRLAFRRQAQIVCQDPFDSLDPRLTVGQSIGEPLAASWHGSARQRAWRIRGALERVQLPSELVSAYPHELSGGQRQRVGIARAIAPEPALVVCDEPVSSLDLSVQAQILQLLRMLQERQGMAYLLISHDLAVVEAMSQRIAVMYLGAIVEVAATSSLTARPWHPYTQALLAAVPRADVEAPGAPEPLGGEPPSASELPSGCRFRTRCPIAQARCEREEPDLLEKEPGHFVACHFRP